MLEVREKGSSYPPEPNLLMPHPRRHKTSTTQYEGGAEVSGFTNGLAIGVGVMIIAYHLDPRQSSIGLFLGVINIFLGILDYLMMARNWVKELWDGT
jgi:hypothetical protein